MECFTVGVGLPDRSCSPPEYKSQFSIYRTIDGCGWEY